MDGKAELCPRGGHGALGLPGGRGKQGGHEEGPAAGSIAPGRQGRGDRGQHWSLEDKKERQRKGNCLLAVVCTDQGQPASEWVMLCRTSAARIGLPRGSLALEG